MDVTEYNKSVERVRIYRELRSSNDYLTDLLEDTKKDQCEITLKGGILNINGIKYKMRTDTIKQLIINDIEAEIETNEKKISEI